MEMYKKTVKKSNMIVDNESCFLCEEKGALKCQDCEIAFCSKEHGVYHKHGSICLPYKVGYLKDKGRVLFATRDIKAFDLVLVDPGTVVGPNYRSDTVCIECLKLLDFGVQFTCPKCRYPMCSNKCINGPRHQEECRLLAVNSDRASLLWMLSSLLYSDFLPCYRHHVKYRLLLLQQENGDPWRRTNQLMDHLDMRHIHPQNDLKLKDTFTEEEINRAVGLLNVNAVCLQNIKCGEELTVQYLSALWGNQKRRRKIKEEWYFDCTCQRCSDKSECSTNISAVKCFDCVTGNLLPENSLDYFSNWTCSRCPCEVTGDKIQTLVNSIEIEFENILATEQYWKYRDILDKYSGSVLHPSHWIMTTARRNLMQYLCYHTQHSKENLHPPISLNEHFKLCEDFWNVLRRIDPGWSEISLFAQRELHFAKLSLLQYNYAAGCVSNEEFGVKSRNSIETLEKLKKYGEYLEFNQNRDIPE